MSIPSASDTASDTAIDPVSPVLVVSNRAMFRRTFAAIVRSFGHPSEAIGLAGTVDAGPVDLGIVDVADLDAAGATGRLADVREALGGARVAAVIDQPDDGVIGALMDAEAAGVLVKASPPAALTDSLAVLLAGRRCRPAPSVSIPPEGLPAAVRSRLTAREQKMLRLVAGGRSVPAVAAALSLTPARVVADMRRIVDIVRGRR